MSIAVARHTLDRIQLELRNPGLSADRLDAMVKRALQALPLDDEARERPAALPLRRVRVYGRLSVIEGGKS